MEFLTKLEETKQSEVSRTNWEQMFNLPYEDYGDRMFNHIKINDKLRLSVQASSAHYCEPRKTLVDIREYKSMEFAVIQNHDLLQVAEVINNEKLAVELKKYYDGGIYANVPVELIEELYQELKKERVK